MSEWVQAILRSGNLGILTLPAAGLLGLLTSVSSCCNVAIIGAVAGYAGSRDLVRQRDVVAAAVSFMVGCVVSLAILGALVGLGGEVAGSKLGFYGQLAMGIIAVLFGTVALELVPLRLPAPKLASRTLPRGVAASAIMGLAIGGASLSCTMLCCGPLVPVVFGMAVVQGKTIMGGAILACFAIGFSLPMAAAMLGIGLGRLTSVAVRITKPIRMVAGGLLIAAGLWLLYTL